MQVSKFKNLLNSGVLQFNYSEIVRPVFYDQGKYEVWCRSSFLASLTLRNDLGIGCCCHLDISIFMLSQILLGSGWVIKDKCFINLRLNGQSSSWSFSLAVILL